MKMNFNIAGYKIDVMMNKYFPYRYWFFYFKKYSHVKGFIIRLVGIYINVREKNATEKLIKIHHDQVKANENKEPKYMYLAYIPECDIIFSVPVEKGIEGIKKRSAGLIAIHNDHYKKMKKNPEKSMAAGNINTEFEYANTIDVDSVVVKYKI
jgi:hypothetical protein